VAAGRLGNTNLAGSFHAVDVWEIDVEQDQIDGPFCKERQHLLAVARFDDRVLAPIE